MNLTYSGKLKKKDGKLIYQKAGQENIYKQFLENIKEGSVIDVFMEVHTDDGTLEQLARLHAMIRNIAIHSGMSPKEIKILIKEACGFCFVYKIKDKEYLECQSFADLGKPELGLAIEECFRMGEELGIQLK